MSSPYNFKLELRDTEIESSIQTTGPQPDYSFYELLVVVLGQVKLPFGT